MTDNKIMITTPFGNDEVPVGTTCFEIAGQYQKNFENDIVLLLVNGKLRELRFELKNDAKIGFITTADEAGMMTYRRSMSFLMAKAIFDLYGKGMASRLRIQFSISKGLYCTLDGENKISEEFLQSIDRKMREDIEAAIPFKKATMALDDAIALFDALGMEDKVRLFNFRRVSRVNVYGLGEYRDYYYGYMVHDTSVLGAFKLYPYAEGFVLQMPVKEDPETVPVFEPQHKLFQVLDDSTKWGVAQGIKTVGDLNRKIVEGNWIDLVLMQEAMQEQKIAKIASMIKEKKGVKFVLIAGPSSSGKTTFSHRLSIQLAALGLKPHPIAVDNYFVEREDTPKAANGEYDFECIEAVDVKLFNEQMQALLRGEEVVLSTFDFVAGKKKFTGPPKKIGENDVLVIEGIHCLNPIMTRGLSDDSKFKIYISALTQLNIDEHNRIPTTDGRLLRRIVRDARTRGASARDTIHMWNSVTSGEGKNIFPYQEEADVMFNSAMLYEFSVMKPYVEANLFAVPKDCPEYVEAKRLLKFLDYFLGINSENVPANSLCREFIGGGCFDI